MSGGPSSVISYFSKTAATVALSTTARLDDAVAVLGNTIALPVPRWHLDEDLLNKGLSGLGKTIGPGIIEHAREIGVDLPPQVDDPNAELTPAIIAEVLREVALHYFPLLAPATG